jgi:hypothetical protein
MIFQNYNCIKKIALVLPLIFLSRVLNAQNEEYDSARFKITEIDSVVQDPPAEESFDEAYKDTTPSFSKSVYFLARRLQRTGGGPDSLQYRSLPDTTVQKLKADGHFWYVNYEFEKKKKEQQADEDGEAQLPFIERKLFQTILWMVIVGAFVAVIIMYLGNSNVRLFRKASKTLTDGNEVYAETDNIFEINYQYEIDKAVKNGNYRFAIRLMFLRQLKNLSDRKIINYKQDRTNFDYLLQLHSTKYYNDFFRLTRFYEYSWYGQFNIDLEKFPAIKNDFENFDRNLK